MRIDDIIRKLKFEYHNNSFHGNQIDENTTRDKILYGSVDKECTGIVTTCFASARVIQEAKRLGCNLIISHEALFWNHGDHTEWLKDNKVFQAKKKLLDETGITVWRDHDYIHAGIPLDDGSYADGIFYGLIQELDWQAYVTGDDIRNPRTLVFPGIAAKNIASEMIEKMNLNGTRIIGDPDAIVHKARIPMHLIGELDNNETAAAEADDIDCLITMEMTDFTTQEYFRDSAYLGMPRAIITIGHFNLEEPGMKYMAKWLPNVTGDLPVYFVQSGDAFHFLTNCIN
ncbi:MAG: hypothetical protein EOM64_05130 [Erysipelotrichia bacterium]|nr:hypothetical protein [Erysipelotrichia bacterium]